MVLRFVLPLILSIAFADEGDKSRPAEMKLMSERTGIRIDIPRGFDCIERDLFIVSVNDNEQESPVCIFDLMVANADSSLFVLYSQANKAYFWKDIDNNSLAPLRFINRELELFYRTYDIISYPYFAGDYITSIKGKNVRDYFGADVIYSYEFPIEKTSLLCKKQNKYIDFSHFKTINRLFFCKDGGYFLSILLLIKENYQGTSLSWMDELKGSIYFDPILIQQKWSIDAKH